MHRRVRVARSIQNKKKTNTTNFRYSRVCKANRHKTSYNASTLSMQKTPIPEHQQTRTKSSKNFLPTSSLDLEVPSKIAFIPPSHITTTKLPKFPLQPLIPHLRIGFANLTLQSLHWCENDTLVFVCRRHCHE